MEEGDNNSLLENKHSNNLLVIPEHVFLWKENYLKEGHTYHSMVTYYNYIKKYVEYGIEISQKSIDKYRNKNSNGAAAAAIKNFFNYLVNVKGFPKDILFLYFGKSKVNKRFPNHITPEEVNKIIESIDDLKLKNLTLVIYTLGLRISEALKLRWDDFNYSSWLQDKSKSGSVNLKKTKGGKFRTLPVPQSLMEKLYNEHREVNSMGLPVGIDPKYNLVFDFGMSSFENDKSSKAEKQYKYIVILAEDRFRKKLYKVSQEVLGKKVNPHQLRHTRAMELLNLGVPLSSIQEFLGHVSLSTTEIYAHASSEKLRKDLEKVESGY